MGKINRSPSPTATKGVVIPETLQQTGNDDVVANSAAETFKGSARPIFTGKSAGFEFLPMRQMKDISTPLNLRESFSIKGSRAKFPSDPFAGKSEETVGIMPNGCYASAFHTEKSLHNFKGFEIHGKDKKRLGAIDTTVTEDEDCIALTWIEKSDLIPNGAVDFAVWYLTKNMQQKNFEVRSIVNTDLFAHLYKNYEMEDIDDDKLRGDAKEINAIAESRLVKKGWTLKSLDSR